MKALITRKLGMTTTLSDKGAATAVTLLTAAPNIVTQIKSSDTDGYQAIQLGAEQSKKIGRAQEGHLIKSKANARIMREFRIKDEAELELNIGDQLAADIFSVGDLVDATAVNKGKGFAGVIKRHGFARGRKTHGGRSYRRPGSIGSMFPQRIFPGKKMAGRMGGQQVTVKNLKIAIVDPKHNLIGVAGAIPGPRKGLVLLKEAK
ncbi:50S ribosomal protein L3 [Candidatus Saccharibacteria bacterium RIFCSPHIGHO2_12_FULL_47_16b]|nr:MAG: 50S ribosomal protein L3 [Candidatus Saccharibacteria bacterium RIFCSPHIGHO2_12_FULL_47_16b]